MYALFKHKRSLPELENEEVQLGQQLNQAEQEITRLKATVETTLSGHRPRSQIEEDLTHYETEVRRLEGFASALTLARDVLQEATEEVHRDFAPRLAQSLGQSLSTELLPSRVGKVTGLEFEYSPGRREPKYTGDRTAFDVYVTFEIPRGEKGFIGIEVKYHENLQGQPSPHRPKYDGIAALMGCFRQEALGQLQQKPLQQLWRGHLLAGILRQVGGFADGIYAFLYPKDNPDCVQGVARYRECLANSFTFEDWTLEKFTAIVKKHTKAMWIEDFADRYLNFSKLGDV